MASRYLVAYDLHEKTEEAYKEIAESIGSCGDTLEIQKSVWFLYSEMKRGEIRDTIKTAMKSDDKLFVAEMHHASWSPGDNDLYEYLAARP